MGQRGGAEGWGRGVGQKGGARLDPLEVRLILLDRLAISRQRGFKLPCQRLCSKSGKRAGRQNRRINHTGHACRDMVHPDRLLLPHRWVGVRGRKKVRVHVGTRESLDWDVIPRCGRSRGGS